MRELRRIIVLSSLLLACAWHSYAQVLISREIEQGGEVFEAGHIFTSPDPLTLTLTDGKVSGVWTMEIMTNAGKYEAVTPITTFDGCCVIEPLAIGYRDAWREARRFYHEEFNRDLFRTKISFAADNGVEDYVILALGLLPSRPVVSDVAFTYVYDWECDAILPNGNLSFDMESKDADRCWLNVSDSYLFEFPDFFAWCAEFDVSKTGTARIWYDADWGEYFAVQTCNEFGYVWGDTYCTTNYIQDKAILDRLEELKRKAGAETVASGTEELSSFLWDNSTLVFSRTVERICVCDINGRNVYSGEMLESANLSGVIRGIYIVTYRSNNQFYKTKIIKK